MKKWGPAFDIAEKPEFDSGIMLCIALNSLLMAASHVGQPTWFTNVVDVLNYVFAVIFTIEIVIKILAYGRQKYFEFYISWNFFDFVVVVGTWVGISLSYTNTSGIGPVTSLFRMFRLGRILRMVRDPRFKKLNELVEVISEAANSLKNAFIFISLVFFVFAVLGVQLFSKDWIDPDGELGVYSNFRIWLPF